MRTLACCLFAVLITGCHRDDEYSVSGLMKMLNDGDAAARYTAVEGLGKYGADAKPAVPLVQAALHDSDPAVRVGAAYALAEIGAPAEPALPDLLSALKSPDAELRLAAAYALPAIAPRSNQASSAIQGALRDRDPRVRAEAARSNRKLKLASQHSASHTADERPQRARPAP